MATCLGNGDYDKAIQDFGKAIRLRPRYADLFFDRGNAWKTQKVFDKALRDYDEAIKLDPKNSAALNAKAWLLAVCPAAKSRDGKEAVELAKRACELSDWKRPDYLATLAAAYAEAGDFPNAVRWQKKALQDEDYASNEGKDARQRLQLYEKEKPYREE